MDDRAKLFVPLRLPPTILDSDLEEFEHLKHKFRREVVYEIRQSYFPPGTLGVLMACFATDRDVEFRKCWSRGAIFKRREVLVMLMLNAPSPGMKETYITIILFGEEPPAKGEVEERMKSVFFKRFQGAGLTPKNG